MHAHADLFPFLSIWVQVAFPHSSINVEAQGPFLFTQLFTSLSGLACSQHTVGAPYCVECWTTEWMNNWFIVVCTWIAKGFRRAHIF